MAIIQILNLKIFKYRLIEFCLIITLLVLGLFTFSRGGMFSGFIALFLGYFSSFKTDNFNYFKILFRGVFALYYLQFHGILSLI